MFNHEVKRFEGRRCPVATFPAKKQSDPDRSSQKVLLNHTGCIPYGPVMKSFHLNSHSQFLAAGTIFGEFLPIVNSVKFNRFSARFIVEAFIVCVEAHRYHVRPLCSHELYSLAK